jgi:exodeoxyribonuclease V alpha subunit
MSLLADLLRGGYLRAVDNALAQSLLRLRPDTPDDVLAAIALASRGVAEGHSRLPVAQAAELLADLVPDQGAPTLPGTADWLELLRASPWIQEGQVAVLEGEALSLRRYWLHETRLARALLARLDTGDRPRLQLLAGGPGTGKTTRAARWLAEFATRSPSAPRVALAAPTGKAAGRLGEVVNARLAQLEAEGVPGAALARSRPIEARTLHRLIGWHPGGDLAHHAAAPLPFDVVVVDEASMVDLPMMARLLDAVAPEACLVLIGDRDQLPSVDTGDVLAALCDAADRNHRLAARRTHLTTVHRQDDASEVGELAELIRAGDADATMARLRGRGFAGVPWWEARDDLLAAFCLDLALPAYRAVQAAASPAAAIELAARFRVLTAVREGPAGSQTLNASLAAALDPRRRGDGMFQGRLVLITENSPRHGLYNGDIGIAWPDEEGEPRVWFDGREGLRAWLPSALPAHESAFALTVHKAQGSEFDRVLLAMPERGARVLSRELLYTGLTRCRREIVLWASEPALRQAIARRAQRWSGLAERLGRE